MTTAIDEATAVLEEAGTLAESSEPSTPDPVADAAETSAVESPTADAPDDSGPSDGDATPDPTSLVDEAEATPSPPEPLDALGEPPDAPIPDDTEVPSETAVDVTPADEKSDCLPTDLADAVDETATVEAEVPATDESPACAEAAPDFDSDALIAEDVPPSEPSPDQIPTPTPSVVNGTSDSQMREIVARLKGVSGKISRAIDRLYALEGENRDQAQTIERLQQEAGELRSENASLKAEVARLAENEAARAALDEIEQKLETAGV